MPSGRTPYVWGPEHWDVDAETGCWNWNKSISHKYGYALFRGGRANRYALGLKLGRPLLPTEMALHDCDNRRCVRPEHLHPGDAAMNMRERDERGRHYQANYTECVNGHDLTVPENVYPRADRKKPRCRLCSMEVSRAYYARKIKSRASKNMTKLTSTTGDEMTRSNLTVSEAIAHMESELSEMREQPRGELNDLDPDTAFEKGYEVAIYDLKVAVGIDPRSSSISPSNEGTPMSTQTLKTTDYMLSAVVEFRQKFGLPIAEEPRPLTAEESALHIQMIRDEFENELVPALMTADTVEIYDATIDVIYYLLGLLANAGMDIRPGFDEVHGSNMSKLDSITGEPVLSRGMELDGEPEGKVLKGANYYRPDLHRIIAELGGDK